MSSCKSYPLPRQFFCNFTYGEHDEKYTGRVLFKRTYKNTSFFTHSYGYKWLVLTPRVVDTRVLKEGILDVDTILLALEKKELEIIEPTKAEQLLYLEDYDGN